MPEWLIRLMPDFSDIVIFVAGGVSVILFPKFGNWIKEKVNNIWNRLFGGG